MAGEIYRGQSAISNIYRGNVAVNNVYRGQTQIWPAAEDGLPAVVADKATIFYSANQSTPWTDQSVNGNDGTVTILGSGQNAAVTHVGGAEPYWNFATDDPEFENPYLDTGLSAGSFGSYTIYMVFDYISSGELENKAVFWGFDSSADQIQLTMQDDPAADGTINIRTNNNNNVFQTGMTSPGQFYEMAFTFESNTGVFYVNNSQVDSRSYNSLNITSNITIGRNQLRFNNPNVFKIAAWGFFQGNKLSTVELTSLHDYYSAIYSDII